MAKYKIKYDRSKCIGAANCVQIAPDTWELDPDGLAKAKKTGIEEKELQKNIKAAKSCPTHAIEIYDEKGKKLV
ncbi:MAG: ferredoxin [Candidatus Woesearchaeota archaeon]